MPDRSRRESERPPHRRASAGEGAFRRDDDGPPRPPARLPREKPREAPSSRLELSCERCRKPIRDLEMEVYFLKTGLCFWCAYVDSQG